MHVLAKYISLCLDSSVVCSVDNMPQRRAYKFIYFLLQRIICEIQFLTVAFKYSLCDVVV